MAPENPLKKKGPKNRAKVIAVGGAKGGIGKSLFVTNLGVFLSQLGKKVVMVDLDLGGANLHLYMGVWNLSRRIDDFLSQKVATIDEIMTATKYGPVMIGGGGGKLGAANIHFARKLKLLRALKTIDADYVIFDLGGDTTYNILDFFLAADQGLVLTTCDPASYMDAYGFTKMALHRKLVRLFGAESHYRQYRDAEVEQIIKDFVFLPSGDKGNRIGDLIDRLKIDKPAHHKLVKSVLDHFRPGIVVTMSEGREQVADLVARLKNVSAKMLGIEMHHLGNMPYATEIRNSARNLVPCVTDAMDGDLARALRRIVLQMEMAASPA